MALRICNTCGTSKSLEDFHRDRSASLGRSWCCKACAGDRVRRWAKANRAHVNASNAASRARRVDAVRAANAKYRAENRDAIRRRQREYQERNREAIRQKSREGARARRAASPEATRAACRRFYWKNQAAMQERARQWAKENPDKALANVYKRRARKKNAPVRERVYRSVVWRRDGGICHICSQPCDPARWDKEHVVPLSRGGEHSYANIRVSHPVCNSRKGARMVA